MRLLATFATRLLAPALVLLALAVLSSGSPHALEASECVQNSDHLCKSNDSCVKFDLIVWEYNQCTTTHEYGTLTECKYCHY